MLKLPELHLNIYTDLMKEKCIVKANDDIINAVVPDTKLEQIIQRSEKTTGGIVGETRQFCYVTEWVYFI